jgi:hypothetical protein
MIWLPYLISVQSTHSPAQLAIQIATRGKQGLRAKDLFLLLSVDQATAEALRI